MVNAYSSKIALGICSITNLANCVFTLIAKYDKLNLDTKSIVFMYKKTIMKNYFNLIEIYTQIFLLFIAIFKFLMNK